ncbi:MAG: GNAT family N-acetyltransferase [Candidatus Electrothrix sp. GW3-4]|uniref:GNAT family N-acetyltransferase n=1 Tax=Candidatus Electrothrix sp. GW3-4 TaxID=3126740 RepID=UPI0030D0680E
MGRITAPEPLTSSHDTVYFDCGVPSLNDWLCKQALRNEVSGVSRTYVVCQRQKVIAFYSFSTGSVTCCTRSSKKYEAIPVIVLARLAVDIERQGLGIGFGLLKDAVARSLYVTRKIEVQALVAHALNDQVKNFYARYGFTELTIDPMVLSLPGSEESIRNLFHDYRKIFIDSRLK